MIIASHESINGQMDKLSTMFDNIAMSISKEEQMKAIEDYIESTKLKDIFKKNIDR